MTQEVLKQMYQLLLTEPHAPTVCAQLERIAREALTDHAMKETQRLGQEIEQGPCVHAKNPKGCYRVRCQLGDKCVDDEMSFRTAPPQRTEQEPVIGKWSLREVYFDEDGEPISHRSPPQRKPLTDEQIEQLEQDTCAMEFPETVRAIEAAHGIKENT